MQEFISPNLNSDDIIDGCIILLFYELIRIYDSQMKTETNDDLSKQNKLAIDILNYVSSNYETITLSSAAEYFNFNPSYFSSIVKKYTKKNFKDLILDERLKKAFYLLRNNTLPIEEITEKCGISNMQFFIKSLRSSMTLRLINIENRLFTKNNSIKKDKDFSVLTYSPCLSLSFTLISLNSLYDKKRQL